MSWYYAQLHMVSLLPTKFHEILFSSFTGVVLTSCFRSIFRGYNGLDVDTMLHLYKIYYILPVLLYELGLILPQGPQLEQLEIAQRSYSSKY